MSRNSILGPAIAVAALLATPLVTRGAEDGAALYKTKCSACHGPNGEGKPAVKAPALKGTAKTADEIVQLITKGAADKKAPHTKPVSGLNDDQAKAIVDFIKSMK
jgi:mono/diheme cytochrome c family protein